MRIVVSDSSCLIDLRKASLLAALLGLPYEFLIPNTLFEDELLSFAPEQKIALLRAGLKVIDLPGKKVLRAREVVRSVPRLSVHDGFAFALAETHAGCILLTGDGALRTFATEHSVEVRGVLWVVDELYNHRLASAASLVAVLRGFSEDPSVRLPRRELGMYIKRYESRAGRP